MRARPLWFEAFEVFFDRNNATVHDTVTVRDIVTMVRAPCLAYLRSAEGANAMAGRQAASGWLSQVLRSALCQGHSPLEPEDEEKFWTL